MSKANEHDLKRIRKQDLEKIEEFLTGFEIKKLVCSIYKKLAKATPKRFIEEEMKVMIDKMYNNYSSSITWEWESPSIAGPDLKFYEEVRERYKKSALLKDYSLSKLKMFIYPDTKITLPRDFYNYPLKEKFDNSYTNGLEEIIIFNDKGEANGKQVFCLSLKGMFSELPFFSEKFWLNIYPGKKEENDTEIWGEQVIDAHEALEDIVNLPKIFHSKKDDKDNYWIIFEHIEGTTLDELAKAKNYKTMESLGSFLGKVNTKGYETGDPNLANFIETKEKEIYLIDLEHTIKTKKFNNEKLTDIEKKLNTSKNELIKSYRNELLRDINNAKNIDCKVGHDFSFSIWQLYKGYVVNEYTLEEADTLASSFIKGYKSVVKNISSDDTLMAKAYLARGLLKTVDDPEANSERIIKAKEAFERTITNI